MIDIDRHNDAAVATRDDPRELQCSMPDTPELGPDESLELWSEYVADPDYQDDFAELGAFAMNGAEAMKKLVSIRARFDAWCERRERNRR